MPTPTVVLKFSSLLSAEDVLASLDLFRSILSLWVLEVVGNGTHLHYHCAVAVVVIAGALVGDGTLAVVGGVFAAVAVIPIAIEVGGGPWPVVIVIVAVTDAVIVVVVSNL